MTTPRAQAGANGTRRKRAAIYARYSSPLQSPTSIQDQVAAGRRYIERCEFEFLEAYSDSSLHAESIEHRPGLLRLLDDMDQKKFDVIVIEQIDIFKQMPEES
jgi:site-specific DNA recombinase